MDNINSDKRKKIGGKEREKRKEIIMNAQPAENIKRGDSVTGKVYNITDEGAFVLTEENHIGFIHNSEMDTPLTEGMAVEARVTFLRPDGRINLSIKPQKEVARLVDSEKLLTYLKQRKGTMPYTDDTDPETIKEKFGISKSAFKRALGKLLKDGKVEEIQGWIVIKGDIDS